jgi:hypothetical protein
VGIEEFADVETRLARTVDQLEAEFRGIHERPRIEAVVSESAEQLKGLDEVRRVRDDIARRVDLLATELAELVSAGEKA